VDPVFDRFARSMSKVPYYPDSTQASGAKLDKLLVNCRNRALTTIQPYLPSLPNYKLLTGWTSEGHLNATAGIQDGSDCIAIALGTVHILRDLFLAMLSHPSLLTNIGSAWREEQRGQSVPNIKITDAQLLDFTSNYVPRDQLRLRYASRLFSCAFNFIFQHEFGHLFHGHIDWKRRALSESDLPSGITPLDLQTVEVDADCFGAIDVFIENMNISFVAGRGRAPKLNSFGSRKNAAFAVFFALYAVFKLFSDNKDLTDEASILSARHPPALYRQRFLLAALN
jgi:hypothetical protein